MARFTITFAVLVPMLLSLTEWHLVSADFYKGIHVTIHNRLGGNRALDLHCRADDRHGNKGVPDNGDFSWKFIRLIRDKYPLSYCDMSWERSPGQRVSATAVHIYEFHRDDPLCGKWCERTLKPDGIYARDLEHQTDYKIYQCGNVTFLREWHMVSANFYKTIHVTIHNKLGGNKILTVQCKANDRRWGNKGDLGEQQIPDNGFFQWTFIRLLSVSDRYPLYYCDMSWERSPGHRVQVKGVTIYEFHRDDYHCGRWCDRTALPDGIIGEI